MKRPLLLELAVRPKNSAATPTLWVGVFGRHHAGLYPSYALQ